MSKIYDRYYNKYKFHIEQFNSAAEVAYVSSTRQMTSSSFDDIRTKARRDWHGATYDEAIDMLRHGYQPTVDRDEHPSAGCRIYQGGHDKWQQQELIMNGSDAQGADISLERWLADGMTGGRCPP